MNFRWSSRAEQRPSRSFRAESFGAGTGPELERRQVLSAASPVVMGSASTADSREVTVSYNVVTPPSPSQPLTFGVYRSAENAFDSSAVSVGSETIAAGASPTLDNAGRPASAVGAHTLTIPLPNGLPLNPLHPYVLVVANPTADLAAPDPNAVASFHVDTIGVVTHGGIQVQHYKATGPPWEQIMAYDLRKQGYNTVIPFDWVAESNTPGAAVQQVPRLLKQVLAAAEAFPANDVVDVQFIGHSEGTVINDQALLRLESAMPPQMKAGWIEDTMLDPHAANTGAPGQQYSVADGPLGWIAKGEIDHYQSQAKDPLVGVPSDVDSAQVFYQHTKVKSAHGVNDDIYNLWGQVPVGGPGVASYYNLTADSVVHNGDSKTGVPEWYTRNVVPSLGDGAPLVAQSALSGTAVSGADASQPRRPVFSGLAAPGSWVKVYVSRVSDPSRPALDGRAITQADGTWSVEGRRLPDGNFRAIAEALPSRQQPRLNAVPTQPLGSFVIDA